MFIIILYPKNECYKIKNNDRNSILFIKKAWPNSKTTLRDKLLALALMICQI